MVDSMMTAFHVSTPRSLEIVVHKARNLLADETVDVELIRIIVDDGETIAEFGRNEAVTSALASLPESVEIAVCGNALSGSSVERVTEPERVEVVSSGVGELTRLQRDGAAYIRLCH
ncbi:MAG: intracellular sulfur oxidation DsrE/DsrF family protein [Natronomonas sp.]|jgi:intracellular sulfur oxidation DsrE/DsrF family protein